MMSATPALHIATYASERLEVGVFAMGARLGT